MDNGSRVARVGNCVSQLNQGFGKSPDSRGLGVRGKFVRQSPLDIGDVQAEGVGDLVDIRPGLLVLPNDIGADSRYRRAAKSDVWCHDMQRAG